jgi:hypothetical protein
MKGKSNATQYLNLIPYGFEAEIVEKCITPGGVRLIVQRSEDKETGTDDLLAQVEIRLRAWRRSRQWDSGHFDIAVTAGSEDGDDINCSGRAANVVRAELAESYIENHEWDFFPTAAHLSRKLTRRRAKGFRYGEGRLWR